MQIVRIAVVALLAAGCATADKPPVDLPEIRSGYVAGYLTPEQLPDTLALLPKPPAEGSAEAAADLARYKALARLEGGARWQQATKDAELRFPAAAAFFSCALDMPISREATPHLNMLLRRIRMDASRANDKPKAHYQRARPYQATKETSCEAQGRKPDSYPSGHASIGWAWALALAELAPDRADRVLARGYAYGESRAVCRMHWRSDLDAGRIVGAATIARLHADPVFVAQMAEARREVAAARAAGAKSPLDCAAEAKALAEAP
jgi:acid phosphatase (class A)